MSDGKPASPPASGLLDPYRQWLDIQTVERPPSHYALLGLPELENDPEAIAEAARNVKKKVRSYQIGKFRPQALAVMTEIGQAVDVLTNAEKKAAYDQVRLGRALELAQANFPHADLGRPLDEMFADWLAQCDKAGLPLGQLMPHLMGWCLERAYNWPKRGLDEVPLPLGLWIYFEAALVGQCVERGPLEQRVRAVKALQQACGVSEQLSRIINQDIARRPQSFAGGDLVKTAADRPRELLQHWVDRLGAGGIVLEPGGRALAALSLLLGLVAEDGRPIAEPLRPRTIPPRKPQAALVALRSAQDLFERTVDAARDMPAQSPALRLALIIALAVTAILLALLVFL